MSDHGGENDSPDIVRPTAWQWDLLARIAQLVGVLALVGLGVSAVAGAATLAGVFAGIMFALFVVSIILAFRVGAASNRERAVGYSTIFDFPGYALRDGRTLEVLRESTVDPETPGRRSLLRGMISSMRKDDAE